MKAEVLAQQAVRKARKSGVPFENTKIISIDQGPEAIGLNTHIRFPILYSKSRCGKACVVGIDAVQIFPDGEIVPLRDVERAGYGREALKEDTEELILVTKTCRIVTLLCERGPACLAVLGLLFFLIDRVALLDSEDT